ncbi:MAG: PAS domain-containing protein, partial [Bacteroidetes bacterium]|nr:PAS domain-containing protein [Bacteroidota bacterium]
MFGSSKSKTQVNNSVQQESLLKELETVKLELKANKLKLSQLEGIQSAMPDPYYILDMENNILLWPPAIAKLTGFSEEEAKKMKCFNIFRSAVCPPNAE